MGPKETTYTLHVRNKGEHSEAQLAGLVSILKRGSSGVFLLRGFALALALITEFALTRSLGKSGYGILAIGLAWLAILQTIGTLGIHTALVRFIPSLLAETPQKSPKGLIAWAGKRMSISGALVGGAFATGVVISPVSPPLKTVLLAVAVMVPIQAANLHCQGALQGLKKPVKALFPTQAGVFVGVIVGIVALNGAGVSLTPPMVALVWALSLGIGLAIAAAWKRKAMPIGIAKAPSRGRAKRVALAGLGLCWSSLAALLIHQADPAMLGFLAGPDEAALYSIANRAGLLILFGLAAVNAAIAPLISQLYSEDKKDDLQRILGIAARGILLYSIPATAFITLAAPWYLPFFGPGFEDAQVPLTYIALAQCLNALTGSVGFLLNMTGNHWAAVKALTVAAILKIALNFWLMPIWGAEGAAMGSAAMLIVWNLWMYIEVKRRLGLEPSALAALPRYHGKLSGFK